VNSSTHAGYLKPSTEIATPSEDATIDADLQGAVVGMTGLPGNMVRPRWQENAPIEPLNIETDWAAIGVVDIDPCGSIEAIVHHGTGAIGDTDLGRLFGGWDEEQRLERLRVLASFYGPNCRTNATMFRDGLYIDQNRATLSVLGYGLIDTSNVVMLPELLGPRWRKRADVHVNLYHAVKRSYPVRNLVEASGDIISDVPERVVPWDTDNHHTGV
jgi:hypothetical protein